MRHSPSNRPQLRQSEEAASATAFSMLFSTLQEGGVFFVLFSNYNKHQRRWTPALFLPKQRADGAGKHIPVLNTLSIPAQLRSGDCSHPTCPA